MTETLFICLAGGFLGILIGLLNISAFPQWANLLGLATARIPIDLLVRAFGLILFVGIFSGLYPAYRAATMTPVDALRFEGGSACDKARRFPLGGMAVQSLWQRPARSVLALTIIAFSVGSGAALKSLISGTMRDVTRVALGAHAEVMIRQDNVYDTTLSTLDKHLGAKVSAMHVVEGVSGILFTPLILPDTGDLFILQGYEPNEFAIQRFQVVEGTRLCCNHQILLGRLIAKTLNMRCSDSIELNGSRFTVAGIFETGIFWEETGGVITLRNAQALAGRSGKVTMYAVKMRDPARAKDFVEGINIQYPGVHAALTSEFAEQMPDISLVNGILNGASLLTMLIGGLGVMNIMLMTVWERRREVGILRAMGWRRR